MAGSAGRDGGDHRAVRAVHQDAHRCLAHRSFATVPSSASATQLAQPPVADQAGRVGHRDPPIVLAHVDEGQLAANMLGVGIDVASRMVEVQIAHGHCPCEQCTKASTSCRTGRLDRCQQRPPDAPALEVGSDRQPADVTDPVPDGPRDQPRRAGGPSDRRSRWTSRWLAGSRRASPRAAARPGRDTAVPPGRTPPAGPS